MKSSAPLRIRRATGVTTLVAFALLLAPAVHAATYRSIATTGPLELLTISDELNCQVLHTADGQAQMYPSLDYEHGACGTQVAFGGTVYGPSDVPGGNDPVDFVPVSQSAVTGAGTADDPFKVTTTVNAGALVITQTDSHVEGREDYRTDIAVRNTHGEAVSLTLYRFGDCYLHEDDTGYGRTLGPGGIACATHPTDAQAALSIWMPYTLGSAYFEGSYEDLYNTISAGTSFPSRCDCDAVHENAAGLSWTLQIAGGGSETVTHTTQVAPMGTDAITMPPPAVVPVVPPEDPLVTRPPAEPGPVTSPPATPRVSPAEACAKRLAGRARWKGALSSSQRGRTLTVRLRPAKSLRRVRVELRRANPCSASARPVAGARRALVRAKRRSAIKIRLSRRVKRGSYVLLVSGKEGRRTVRSAAVLAIR